MKIMRISPLYALLIALPLVGAATTDIVVKKNFSAHGHHATAHIHISANGTTYGGIVSADDDEFFPTGYTYRSYPNNHPSEALVISSDDPDKMIKHIRALSLPEQVSDTFIKFFNTYNSFRKIKEVVDNTAAENVPVKELFYPKNTEGPAAEIFISKAGITHGGTIMIPYKTGIPQYAYLFYPGDNDTSRWNHNLITRTGLLPNIYEVIARAEELSAPEDVLTTIRIFMNNHNTLKKIQDAKEAQIRALQKKKWQKPTCEHALKLKSEGKKADEEFSKELDDILEYHRQTYGE